MPRVCLIIMDSFGLGGAPDAATYDDVGANTFGNIAAACDGGRADSQARTGPLKLPFLMRHGLANAAQLASGGPLVGVEPPSAAVGQWGIAIEQSAGKDTPSGHWEIAGQPVRTPWYSFAASSPCFPDTIIEPLVERFDLPGVLGNKHASGTEIIAELGDEHRRTARPIVYTSIDSVFQIAAHEQSFGLDRLYAICEYMRVVLDDYNVGRVIARPFVGTDASNYQRTENRRDYAMPPPSPTLLNRLEDAGRHVISVGKIADVFAHQATGDVVKAGNNDAIFDATVNGLKNLEDGGLLFSNFVDFDSVYGHRRNVAGYAAALEEFDARLPELKAALEPDDRVIISADHGCDPTLPGSDHTRETVPVLAFSQQLLPPEAIGRRDSFADIGQSVANYLDVEALEFGRAWSLEGNS